jgi:ribonuclease HI
MKTPTETFQRRATTTILTTDGSCTPNPGLAGYGCVLRTDGVVLEFSGAMGFSTNNRAEFMAILVGLSKLKKRQRVLIRTDSKYAIQAITVWVSKWKTNGWRLRNGKPVKNRDLIEKIVKLLAVHRAKFKWVRGHTGDPDNERADQLAVQAARSCDMKGVIP